jgi:hypothetical protein
MLGLGLGLLIPIAIGMAVRARVPSATRGQTAAAGPDATFGVRDIDDASHSRSLDG